MENWYSFLIGMAYSLTTSTIVILAILRGGSLVNNPLPWAAITVGGAIGWIAIFAAWGFAAGWVALAGFATGILLAPIILLATRNLRPR